MKIFVFDKAAILTAVIALLVALVLIPVSMTASDPVAGTGGEELPIYSVETEEKKVAITLNAAWDDHDIDSILETLAAYDCKCTFFLVGTWAEKYPDAARKIKEAGHEIASHSYDHAHFSALSEEEIQEDMDKSVTTIKKITGSTPALFRAPYGEYTKETVEICRQRGQYVIQWDVEPVAAVGRPLGSRGLG